MSEPIEDAYFKWLCAKVLSVGNKNYVDLLKILHNTEFVWLLPMDSNRAEDGKDLREDFLIETNLTAEPSWSDVGCSIFEMLVAFVRHAEFQTDQPAKDWFWEIIANLDLSELRQVSEDQVPMIDDILYAFVWRTYDYSGHGGMFPLRWPKQDQRGVEIWYQFFAYLEDQGRM